MHSFLIEYKNSFSNNIGLHHYIVIRIHGRKINMSYDFNRILDPADIISIYFPCMIIIIQVMLIFAHNQF